MQILIIEDEKRLADALGQIMQEARYQADIVYDGRDGLAYASSGDYDVIVLDVMLPGMDGFEVVHHLRESKISTPVIMLTALDDVKNKITGLDSGADDYMTKPFVPEELLARIRAAIRHFRGTSKNQGERQKVTFLNGKLVIDYDKHRVYVEEQDAGLTQNEFRLLSLLGKYAGKVLTYDYMMKEIWGPNMKGDNRILRVNMANIRRKIEKNPGQPQFIFTEVGVGYRIIETDS